MARSRLWLAGYVVVLILLWWHAASAGMDNRGFIVAGYGLTWGVLLAYARLLSRRGDAISGALRAMGERTTGHTGPFGSE